jgi:tRNA-Thr(GGU) m(6)t(6)A37 methyltransferase TsaA
MNRSDSSFHFDAIGVVRSCYKQKFGIPRQPGLVDVPGIIELCPGYAREDSVRGLDGFSHVWVLFVFHQALREGWKATVRPPRLGGNERVGVFASRSMFRPNPIGLSVVALSSIECRPGTVRLHIRGGDFLDGTPVLDIKPYLPYADALPAARGAYAPQSPEVRWEVAFTSEALARLEAYRECLPDLHRTIVALLQYDPRPAYQGGREDERRGFAMRLYDFDLKWSIDAGRVLVQDLVPVGDGRR